ncbi:speckle-type POZ protein-like isoform X1 [Schistocerca serialis cubense]|uniref:speckle-type POZ protein-like isoform X1 n=2 Tax=Schistocerca serialis cubense TaxID=2023355 RepID=UPI00214EA365|nr:speckle-type POZ protein-like isoform X1 [Schistocerca serialis cubense]XP_049943694.1 speckle-type POZ protein-like isoform X1 [Schistocerca serialis cubense]XP_049943695.1 speckle-type POZ protein-like isoform X1 [Schistocerca serialis cubense]XP_049943696.1 speckle-type POZ protein-like isoform X1 [Schistocerca serialis cubense]XP_049943697.1 speckle-type POZ protein-like isoform X1 [Schistocerca serialis cubense]XP_049943698.1 speckle-type POZ protein-like isoform X1 [Schistocerca seria
MSQEQRTLRRAVRQFIRFRCHAPTNMFPLAQSPQFPQAHSFGNASLTPTSTVPLSPVVEGTICQPPMITASRCNNVSAAGITRFEKEKVVYTWTVTGIKNWPEDVSSIASTSFRHPNSSEWCMVLSKKGNELHLCFWLKVSKEPAKANLKATLSLGGDEKREVYPPLYCTLKGGEKSAPKSISDTFPITDGYRNVGDRLTFECEVEIMCIVWDELPSASALETEPGLARDFGNLLESQDFSDFILQAGDVKFKAHKAVLSTRSPVFARMLQQDMKEAQENCVYIEGVEPGVVAEALRYMYTARAPALRDMARGLLVFADRYDLCELKSQCEVELARRLTIDNAANSAVFAVVNSCDALLKASVAFIKRHIEEVMGTTGWKDALHSDPDSVEKISQLIAAGSQSKSDDDSAKKNVIGKPLDGIHWN